MSRTGSIQLDIDKIDPGPQPRLFLDDKEKATKGNKIMSIIEELEKVIGKYPEIASLHDPEEYYRWVVKLCAWYKRAREHETARANKATAAKERWKTEAVNYAFHNKVRRSDLIHNVITEEAYIKSIDKGK